jgi:hypothetical protein
VLFLMLRSPHTRCMTAFALIVMQCLCSVQDVLLVMYLANLVRTHVALADKLGTQALPLV